MAKTTPKTVDTAVRKRKIVRTYRDSAGDAVNTPVGAASIEIQFSDGSTVTYGLDGLGDEVVRGLALHGLGQKLGDSVAGSKGDPAELAETIAAVYERLTLGEWSARRRRSGTPKISVLAEAVARALRDAGETVDDDRLRQIVERLKSDVELRARTEDDAVIAAHVAEIKAERAAARAAAAKEAAADVDASALSAF